MLMMSGQGDSYLREAVGKMAEKMVQGKWL